jgi:hypothetical protein
MPQEQIRKNKFLERKIKTCLIQQAGFFMQQKYLDRK